MEKVDARKLNCPAPVLAAREVIESQHPDEIQVTVDNDAARQNVERFLKSQFYAINVEDLPGGDFAITGSLDTDSRPSPTPEKSSTTENQKIMVMVATDSLGHGDDELGKKLMVNFLKTLKEMGKDLWRLVFVNKGVTLTIFGSDVLEALKELDAKGVHILVCGTCLDHFNLLDKKQVGETTNMLDIVTSMQLADKVINL